MATASAGTMRDDAIFPVVDALRPISFSHPPESTSRSSTPAASPVAARSGSHILHQPRFFVNTAGTTIYMNGVPAPTAKMNT